MKGLIKIEIDAEESGVHPELPPASILGARVGPDGFAYDLVKLETPVRTTRQTTKEQWVLSHLLIKPKFEGDALARLLRERDAVVPVGIANVLDPRVLQEQRFDWSQVEYFAVGYVRLAASGRPDRS